MTSTTTQNTSLRQRIDDNLDAHLDCTRLLLSTLESEHAALLANDVVALERLTATKAAAADRLGELGSTLNRLRSESGLRRIDELLARCDPSGAAGARWSELIDLAGRCHDANRDNAGLLDARSHQIRSALHLLGRTSGDQTYGRYGSAGNLQGSRPLGLA